jgi:hypothetical protein
MLVISFTHLTEETCDSIYDLVDTNPIKTMLMFFIYKFHVYVQQGEFEKHVHIGYFHMQIRI